MMNSPIFQTAKWMQTHSGLLIPSDYIPKRRPKAFDFFAGAGGFSCGLHAAGFHVIGACEFSYDAAHTYMVNLGNHPMKIHFDTEERKKGFDKYLEKQIQAVIKKHRFIATTSIGNYTPDAFMLTGSGWISRQENRDGCEHFWIADIRNLTGKHILDTLRMEVGELDLIVGGPPCQGFSRAGQQDENDPRNNLVFEFARMIVEMNPKTIIMENVPEVVNMETADGVNIIEGFCKILADGSYAPFESLCRSLLGRNGAKAVLRKEHNKKARKVKKKDTDSKVIVKEPDTAQGSLF